MTAIHQQLLAAAVAFVLAVLARNSINERKHDD